MIYGPYKRQSKAHPMKSVRQHHYKARSDKQTARLRIALVICIIALAIASGRLVVLRLTERYVPVFADWRAVGTLAAASILLSLLLWRAAKRNRS